eukprot:6483209-Amphidinium_carterae.1
MIEGAPQSATHGAELILVQLVTQRHHPKRNVPEYLWRGKEEQKAFWSLRRNAEKQDKKACQGYIWQRLHEDDYIPTKITPVPHEQRAEFYDEDSIRRCRLSMLHQGRGTHGVAQSKTKVGSLEAPRTSLNRQRRLPRQFPEQQDLTDSNEPVEQIPVIPIPDEPEQRVEPIEEPATVTAAPAADGVEPTAQAAEIHVEPALLEPLDLPQQEQPPQLVDPAIQPTQGVTLQQSYNMINDSWECLAQHTFGAQHANALLEARVISLEQATPKLMTDIMKRITHIYEKLNENDTTLGGQLGILKEDVKVFFEQIDNVKKAADHVKAQIVERMAVYETHQLQQQEQIDALKKQVRTLETIIRLMYDAEEKRTPGSSSAATPAPSKRLDLMVNEEKSERP